MNVLEKWIDIPAPEKLAGIFIDLDLIEHLNFTTGMYYCSQG
jgi:hypothetical protein